MSLLREPCWKSESCLLVLPDLPGPHWWPEPTSSREAMGHTGQEEWTASRHGPHCLQGLARSYLHPPPCTSLSQTQAQHAELFSTCPPATALAQKPLSLGASQMMEFLRWNHLNTQSSPYPLLISIIPHSINHQHHPLHQFLFLPLNVEGGQ